MKRSMKKLPALCLAAAMALPLCGGAWLCTAKHRVNLNEELDVALPAVLHVDENGMGERSIRTVSGRAVGGVLLYSGTGETAAQYLSEGMSQEVSDELRRMVTGDEDISAYLCQTGQYGTRNLLLSVTDTQGREEEHNLFLLETGQICDVWVERSYQKSLRFLFKGDS